MGFSVLQGREERELSEPSTDRAVRERRQLKAARHDPSAFAPIFDAYIDAVVRFCRLRLRSREQAEDAASQIFLKALSNVDSYNGGSVPAWLFAIARTTVIDLQRRRQLQTTRSAIAVGDDQTPSPESVYLANDDIEWLHGVLDQLTDSQRLVIQLRLAGLTGVEIAEVAGRSAGSVRALQFRAVAELRRLYESEWRGTEARDA